MKTETSFITPTRHEKLEWARLAQWAYSHNKNLLGHKYSSMAALRDGEALSVKVFDEYQEFYRTWLLSGENALALIP